jgi:hypothetical protein
MPAIPSLSLGMAAIYCLVSAQQNPKFSRVLLFTSGFLLGLGLQIKAWIIVILPTCLVCLVLDDKHSNKLLKGYKPILRDIGLKISIFLVSLMAGILSPFLVNPYFSIEQVFGTHFSEEQIYQGLDISKALSPLLSEDLIFLTLFLLGLILIIFTRNNFKSILIPTTWMIVNCVVFWNHRPIWFHYYPIFSIPIIWISSYSFCWSWTKILEYWHFCYRFFKRVLKTKQLSYKKGIGRYQTILNSFVITLHLLIALFAIGKPMSIMRGKFISYTTNNKAYRWDRGSEDTLLLINSIAQYKEQTQWLFVDNPIISIYADIPVPPEIAVVTVKRTNYATVLLSSLETYRPEQIVITNVENLDEFKLRAYLTKHYRTLRSDDKFHHYLLKNDNQL